MVKERQRKAVAELGKRGGQGELSQAEFPKIQIPSAAASTHVCSPIKRATHEGMPGVSQGSQG